MTSTTTKAGLKYAIIGAGPCGLAAAKVFLQYGIPFEAFEAADDVGGVWNINSPTSTMYESAHLISSKRRTEFTDFPMSDAVADYPSHRDMLAYFKDYATHYQLYPHIRLNTTVEKAEPNADGTWRLRFNDGSEGNYAGVVIASGLFRTPNMPQWKGHFDGTMMHSASYKSAKVFEGKRVLVVGAGNSGCDIAVDAVYHAQSVAMSLRRGYHFIPKYVFGVPADTIGGRIKLPRRIKQWVETHFLRMFTGNPVRFGFPKPDHRLYELHPVVNTLALYHAGHGDIAIKPDIERLDGQRVWFTDGTSGVFDILLNATGYQLDFPFIKSEYINWQGDAPQLFLQIFAPNFNNLFVLGLIEAAGIGWQGRHDQAELVARYIVALEQKTDKIKQFERLRHKGIDLSGGYNYVKLARMAFYVHRETYLKTIKQMSDLLH